MTSLFLALIAIFSAPAFSAEIKEPAQKTSWFAEVNRSAEPESQIPGLIFSNTRIPVLLSPKSGKLRPLVEVKGRVSDRNSKLYLIDGKERHAIESLDEFSIFLFLNAGVSELLLECVHPDGKVEHERVMIHAPEIQEYRISPPWGDLIFSIGGGGFNYRQTHFGDFKSSTGLLSAKYQTPTTSSRFSLDAELDLTVWTLHSSPTNSSPQSLKIQTNAAYRLPLKDSKWKLYPLAGVGYLTMFSNGSPFGFSNLITPLFGLRARYSASLTHEWIARIVYLPLVSITDLKRISYDLSLAWSHQFTNTHRVEIGVGRWQQSYSASETTDVSTGFVLFKVGYSL